MNSVLITGANRGIGLEFTRQYLARGEHVIACARTPEQAAELLLLQCPQLEIITLDVGSEASVLALAEQLEGRSISLYINNAGVYGQKQALDQVDPEEWLKVLWINTIAPLLLTRVLLPYMRRQGAKMVYLSSKMGSIAENSSGSTYVYRTSKTALNQVVKSLSIDLAAKGIAIAALHPGWVRTDMGGPNGLTDVQTSVSGLIKVVDELNHSTSGRFYNYDGSEIPW